MKKRKYTKKSSYWQKISKVKEAQSEIRNVEPMMCGENYYVSSASTKNLGPDLIESTASCGGRVTQALRDADGATTGSRGKLGSRKKQDKYKNIAEGLLPYTTNKDGVDSRDTIELCQKAYANIPIFRNAIDVMSEFSNSEVYLEGGSESARKFIYKWFEKINFWKLKDQYFREYYRSGNVFFYRIDGEFNKQDIQNLNKIYGSANFLEDGKIPVRYILLNPYDITSNRTTSFESGAYKKVLSEYELERLRNPTTQEDEDVFNGLSKEVQKMIKQGGFNTTGILMPLDPKKLIYSFYKKQDYEPFAIPFGFPVLDDLNWKIELKKIDQAISRTIENVVLLITMGAEPDKGGVNPHSLSAMQCLFQNESVGRVLVSDYTTKADFIMPDINKILGPQKYEIVNQDIREGLQNIIVGKENYSSTQIKAQIFLERLKEARNAFLNDFIMPQVKLLSKKMGFKKYPTVRFQEIDIKDEVQFQRVITRLLEIGILSPEQGMSAIRTGIFPHADELETAQEKYLNDREKGMYNPLVGGVPLVEAPGAEEERDLKKKQIKKQSQAPKQSSQPLNKQKTPNEAGRPTGATASENFSRKNIQETVYDIEKLRSFAVGELKKKFKVKKLNSNQNSVIDKLIESIVISRLKDSWSQEIESCIKDQENISKLETLNEVLEISSLHQLPDYPSAILFHSR